MRAGELVSVGTLAFAGDRAWHSGEIIICGGDPHDWGDVIHVRVRRQRGRNRDVHDRHHAARRVGAVRQVPAPWCVAPGLLGAVSGTIEVIICGDDLRLFETLSLTLDSASAGHASSATIDTSCTGIGRVPLWRPT